MDKDFGPVERLNVLSTTLVRLYLARPPLARVVCAIREEGFGCIRLTISYASRILNLVMELAFVLIR